MTLFATITASAEANGHPGECTEPAPGSVSSDSDSSVTITDGTTEDIATVATASIDFSSHAHDHDSNNGCHDNQSHSIDPSTTASSVSVDGSPMYLVGNGVGTDPGSNGDVDITDGGVNSSVRVT